jgi:hypothetical protein
VRKSFLKGMAQMRGNMARQGPTAGQPGQPGQQQEAAAAAAGKKKGGAKKGGPKKK